MDSTGAGVQDRPKDRRRGGWLPGQSGNPQGRKRGRSILDELERKMRARGPCGQSRAGLLADRLIAAAIDDGDLRAAMLILERLAPVRIAEAILAEREGITLPGQHAVAAGAVQIVVISGIEARPGELAARAQCLSPGVRVIDVTALPAGVSTGLEVAP